MVTAKVPVETLINSSATITHSGYYVTVPIQYYSFEVSACVRPRHQ